MLKVGITGNIGSGKTTVCRVFSLLGVPVFNADEQARQIQQRAGVRKQIGALFGAEYLDEDGQIDRRKLASLVFSHPDKLVQLNTLIHPLVHEAFNAWICDQHSAYVLYESAILIETGYHRKLDKTILVTAPVDVRIDRVVSRDKIAAADVRRRMQFQKSQELLENDSDYVIINDEKTLIIPQVIMIDEQLRF